MVSALSDRRNRVELLERVKPGGVCAELGVLKGDYSAEILRVCHPRLLYLVDIFDGNVPSADQNGQNYELVDMGTQMPKLIERFHDKPVELVKARSYDWLISLRPDSLDFCYIDTSHEYKDTILELTNAQYAVKQGGIIAGHDYSHECFPGVVQAVNEFCSLYHLSADIYRGDSLASFLIMNE